MQYEMTENDLLCLLRNGVKRSSDLIAQITDYHGGPVTTEYMLTSDIARELIERHHEVEVEYLCRRFANAMTLRKSGPAPKFDAKRTDVAVLYKHVYPVAIIEVKIGVKTLRGIERDLIKITSIVDVLKAEYASSVWGAAVFQVHAPGSKACYEQGHFRNCVEKIETKIKTDLAAHAEKHAGYEFKFRSLQREDEGYTARELEPEGDGPARTRNALLCSPD